jgi:hypothetical protein
MREISWLAEKLLASHEGLMLRGVITIIIILLFQNIIFNWLLFSPKYEGKIIMNAERIQVL